MRKFLHGLKYAVLLFIAFLHVIPFYVLINMALKLPTETTSKWRFPVHVSWDNFANAWREADLSRAIFNNVFITASAVALVVIVGALASYPLARHQSRLNTIIYTVSVACLIVPALTILVPLYKFIVDLGGINTYWAAILTQVTFALPMTIFLYTGFINTVPRELDEAGLIDGSSRLGIFFRIILPLLKPITATVIIIMGVQIWNDYQFSIFFLQKVQVQTIPVALSQFISQFSNQLNWVAAGCLIGMMPMTVVYLFLQKYFIKGMADGAIKG
ncbi:carbohydrate ABC transporter permease [Paenibacillus guangzhouensis]|uniref:carbohydrate ABC transporter permease n=1 Tax=Paenibacillus guangzhouensis TaxID=1473112 RepID=UPI0012673C91|nr:carbohydrate ABC transporter permease [Paenibacillus guangzhouensis]